MQRFRGHLTFANVVAVVRTRRPSATVVALAAGLLAAHAPSAQAATIVGEAPPGVGNATGCSATGNVEHLQASVEPATPSYTVPAPGVITAWRTQGDGPDAGDTMALRIYTQQDATHYTPVFDSGLEVIVGGKLNIFLTRFPVSGGELLGLREGAIGADGTACLYFPAHAGDSVKANAPPAPLGTSLNLMGATSPLRLDIAAVVEPDADKDGFGDETQDATFTKTPRKRTKSEKATFRFTGSASFQCRIDKKAFKPCTSPKKLRNLKVRRHRFRVRPVDPQGSVGPEASFRWRVVD